MSERAYTRRPRTDPEGWTSLRSAFLSFGRAAIGSEYGAATFSLQDIEGVIEQRSYPSEFELLLNDAGDHELNLDSPTGARLFTPAVCRSFLSAVRNQRLRTGYASKGAGEVLPMPLGAWRTDDDYVRFAGWSFDPGNFGAVGDKPPSWVFVNNADLSIITGEVQEWRATLPEWDGESEPDSEVTYLNRWPLCFHMVGDELWVEPPILPKFSPARLELVYPAVVQPPRSSAIWASSGSSNERLPSAKHAALLAYRKFFRGSGVEQRFEGDALFGRYQSWVNRNDKPAYGRSQWYKVWEAVRQAEAD